MNKGRKISGGKYHANRKKKLYERHIHERAVVLGETKKKFIHIRGGKTKTILLRADEANVLENSKVKKAKIINVVETPQNKFFARQNRLMKGVIIETSAGRARITNRPSQEGQVNAILLQEK